jgi:uncharacterized protein
MRRNNQPSESVDFVMSIERKSPWVVDTRELGRRAGLSRELRRVVQSRHPLGVEGVIAVPTGADIELDVLLESVVEGVLVSGTAHAPIAGECSRCLDPIKGDAIDVDFTELYAYPDSATEQTTDEDEIARLVDDLVDLEPVVRDATVLALPSAPLCTPDCAGLCPDCGGKWVDLGPDHRHETIDPRWAALTERFSPDRDD